MPREPELGLELLGDFHCVVDEGEAGALAVAEVGFEAVRQDAVERRKSLSKKPRAMSNMFPTSVFVSLYFLI